MTFVAGVFFIMCSYYFFWLFFTRGLFWSTRLALIENDFRDTKLYYFTKKSIPLPDLFVNG